MADADAAADDGPADRLEDRAEEAGERAEHLQQKRWYRVLVAIGLVSFGVVHLLIAAIAVQVAWTGGGGQASSQGALREVARTPVGLPILLVIVVGMVPLALWQLTQALSGYDELEDGKPLGRRNRRRLASAGRAVVYLALAVSAAKVAAGARGSSDEERTWTGRLLGLPAGQVLVLVVAAAVVAVGVALIVKGVRRKFTDDLSGGVRPALVRLGQVGHVTKGLALAAVGGLFAWAAVTHDARKAGGMDQALSVVRRSPFGDVLLTVIAVGIACFGLYCFVWARHPRRD
ncbi:hypothetical protein FHX74_002612 [Friedmanniella endophytica]|uniref:DUF1206 domain-containing protein n=1 Tax=Microlunatus kandeliicorticis TaxID=1759536 RepID=A0A7W3P6H6_9ACTN|nr:hypothetical protein [Microlunatus kandeliicorticis]